MPGRRAATAPPGCTSSSTSIRGRACRSTRSTACTARPATSRIRSRTSSGLPPKAAAGRTTRTCNSASVQDARKRAAANTLGGIRLLRQHVCHRGEDLLEDVLHLLVRELGRYADDADEKAAVAVATRAVVRHVFKAQHGKPAQRRMTEEE